MEQWGATLGGPARRQRTYYFASYEGLRLTDSHAWILSTVPPAARIAAPIPVQPLLNAFPLPNGPDLGRGTAAFSASYSDPSTLNSSGIRVDYLPLQRVTVFGRYSDAPSSLDQRAGSYALAARVGRGTDILRTRFFTRPPCRRAKPLIC